LVKLDEITVTNLNEAIVEGWLARAPQRLVNAYLDEHR
jgi:hypothetical protein